MNKSNLYLYNYGNHCFNGSIGYMQVWDETKGERGSENLASCIRKHIMANAKTHKHIVFILIHVLNKVETSKWRCPF